MVIRSLVRRWRMVAFAAGAAVACLGKHDPPKVPLGTAAKPADAASPQEAAHSLLGPAAKAALDSGNALFRKKVYKEALAQYRSASDLAPQHSAPLFGIYMVARATNDSVMADSALAGIRQRSGGAMAAGPHGAHGPTDSAFKQMHAKLQKTVTKG